MSNTKAKQNGHYSLAKYRAEAKGEPFVLDVDESTTITVPRPTGAVLMDVEEATSSRQIIKLLAGDQAEEFLKIVGDEDYTVLQAVATDMQKHFGLGE